jgi:hypothetical protein
MMQLDSAPPALFINDKGVARKRPDLPPVLLLIKKFLFNSAPLCSSPLFLPEPRTLSQEKHSQYFFFYSAYFLQRNDVEFAASFHLAGALH